MWLLKPPQVEVVCVSVVRPLDLRASEAGRAAISREIEGGGGGGEGGGRWRGWGQWRGRRWW